MASPHNFIQRQLDFVKLLSAHFMHLPNTNVVKGTLSKIRNKKEPQTEFYKYLMYCCVRIEEDFHVPLIDVGRNRTTIFKKNDFESKKHMPIDICTDRHIQI